MEIEPIISEPGNLRWENLDASKYDIGKRKVYVAILILLVMFLTFSVIFVANIMKPTNSIKCPNEAIDFSEAYANKDDKRVVECFCRSIGISDIYEDSKIKSLCWDSYLKFVSIYLISLLVACVIGIVNFGLKLLLRGKK